MGTGGAFFSPDPDLREGSSAGGEAAGLLLLAELCGVVFVGTGGDFSPTSETVVGDLTPGRSAGRLLVSSFVGESAGVEDDFFSLCLCKTVLLRMRGTTLVTCGAFKSEYVPHFRSPLFYAIDNDIDVHYQRLTL